VKKGAIRGVALSAALGSPLQEEEPMNQNRQRTRRISHLEPLWESRRMERAAAIDRLIEEASDRGECTDRMYWTLLYDFEHAPLTTNLEQLAEVGFEPPDEAALSDAELTQSLWEMVETLAELGVFLLHTDHLSDRELYRQLVESVLAEPVRALPPDAGVSEFIDLVGGGDDAQCAIYQAFYATQSERESWRARGCEEIPRRRLPHDRDQFLPRPDAHSGSVSSDEEAEEKMEDGRLPLK